MSKAADLLGPMNIPLWVKLLLLLVINLVIPVAAFVGTYHLLHWLFSLSEISP